MNLGIVGSIAPGTCVCTPYPYPDIGIVMSGSPMRMEANMPVAMVGSLVMFSCGVSTIMSGSLYEFEMNMPVAITGSIVSGCGNGTLIGTSPQYMTN